MSIRVTINELTDKRKKLVADARKLVDAAEAEKRGMSAEEKAQWDQMQADVDGLKDRIDVLEKSLEQEEPDEEEEDDLPEDERDEEGDGKNKDDDDDEGERSIRLADGRIARLVKPGKGRRSLPRPGGDGASTRMAHESPDQYKARLRRSTPEYRAAWFAYLNGGMGALTGRHARAIQADSDVVGGYLVAPQEFVGKLIKFVDNLVYVRQKATKFTVTEAQTLGAPSLDTDPADADWTSELATGNEDTAMAFGKRELTPHPVAKRIKVANKLLRMATLQGGFSQDNSAQGGGADSLVMQRFGYKFAVTQEKAYYTGNGAQQPLGLFTTSSRGISTARDVLTGNSTGFTADCFINAKYTLKQQYQSAAEWFFNRTAMPLIRQLKDGNGQYIWAAGLSSKDPDTLLDRPINISEYVPNTFTTGNYVGGLFCLEFYWIVDSVNFEVQRLVELYAEQAQTGFIGRQELDGMPVLEEAFVRLKTN